VSLIELLLGMPLAMILHFACLDEDDE